MAGSSPWDQMGRSVPVGINLRCLAPTPRSGSMKTAVKNKDDPARSITPRTKVAPVRLLSSASAANRYVKIDGIVMIGSEHVGPFGEPEAEPRSETSPFG